jgi:hypothetical protein
MAFHAFRTTYHLNVNAVCFPVPYLICQTSIFCVKSVIAEIDIPASVAIDTPSHCQVTGKSDPSRFLNRSMAFLAGYFPCADMLRMAKKNMIRKVMNLDPFDRFFIFVGTYYFGNLKYS